MPLDWSRFWQDVEVREYEPITPALFASMVKEHCGADAQSIDCGAHIGLVSHYVAQATDDVGGGYIVPDQASELSVSTVDALELDCTRSISMKINVERVELPILQGAAQALRAT